MSNASPDLVVEILKAEFKHRSERNKAYSLRAFARHLGVDASNLSKVLSYRLKPGPRLKSKLAKRVGFDPRDWDGVANTSQRPNTRDADYTENSVESFKIISDWFHYALLEVIKLTRYVSKGADATCIADELNIPIPEVERAINRMLKLGMLKWDKGRQALCNTQESSSAFLKEATTNKALRDNQRQVLELAIDALENTPLEHRSQTSMTMAIDSKKLPEAKRLIKNFRRNLARYLSEGDDLDSVYHLSISLYPVSKLMHDT